MEGIGRKGKENRMSDCISLVWIDYWERMERKWKEWEGWRDCHSSLFPYFISFKYWEDWEGKEIFLMNNLPYYKLTHTINHINPINNLPYFLPLFHCAAASSHQFSKLLHTDFLVGSLSSYFFINICYLLTCFILSN